MGLEAEVCSQELKPLLVGENKSKFHFYKVRGVFRMNLSENTSLLGHRGVQKDFLVATIFQKTFLGGTHSLETLERYMQIVTIKILTWLSL